MTARRIGIIFNGATGELAQRQHLPALVAMRDEGGLLLSDGTRLVPDAVLVGRDPAKLAVVAARTGFARTAASLDDALASPAEVLVFDAAPTGLRGDVLRRAIAAGKHVYAEKPVAGSAAEALALHAAAQGAGVKAGTVQDKLFLPGFAALLGLRRAGFFGQVLEVRVEVGRWVQMDRPHPLSRSLSSSERPAPQLAEAVVALDDGGVVRGDPDSRTGRQMGIQPIPESMGLDVRCRCCRCFRCWRCRHRGWRTSDETCLALQDWRRSPRKDPSGCSIVLMACLFDSSVVLGFDAMTCIDDDSENQKPTSTGLPL